MQVFRLEVNFWVLHEIKIFFIAIFRYILSLI